MLRVVFLCLLFANYIFADDFKVVVLDEGAVKGEKYWDGDFYEFFGVPYAQVPTGRDRYQGPLPPKPWDYVLEAKNVNVRCNQSFVTDPEDDDFMIHGDDECLVMNLIVPTIASEKRLVPVLVYIHSGAFAIGHGNIAKFNYLARHDVIVVSFNYRLGAIGFACLGTKEIPGNAGMKDQVAALRWINKNIKKFGGNPNKVTVAGFSVGASMAELLALSKSTEGLIDKIILESGSALSPFAINRDPISTAKNMAISFGYKDTGKIEDLTEFYLNATIEDLVARSLNFFLSNSTFGYAPCVEKVFDGIEPFLTESPLDIINRGENKQVAVLTGFSNMEGLSRSIKFDTWSQMMNKKFSDFLPADLVFDNDKTMNNFIKEIKKYYFKGREVSNDNVQGYVDYFSDSMFKYAIMKSAKLHSLKSKRPVFLYEFSYVGELNMRHNFMDKVKGASHRDITGYVLDFYSFTTRHDDFDTRDRLTMMWTDFVKYEDPTAYESPLVNFKWLKYSEDKPYYLHIDKKVRMKRDLFVDGYNFWNKIYEKYYWNPTPVTASVTKKDKI